VTNDDQWAILFPEKLQQPRWDVPYRNVTVR
jgi:hypothetical protein